MKLYYPTSRIICENYFKDCYEYLPTLPLALPQSNSFFNMDPWCLTAINDDDILFTNQVTNRPMATRNELEKVVDALNNPTSTFVENKRLENARARLVFFTNSAGDGFVLKQILPTVSHRLHYTLILEHVGHKISEEQGILGNLVQILPYTLISPFKPFPHQAATLHTLINGKSVKEIDIRLLGGLAYKALQDIAKHPDLARIMALDTFLGNPDRGYWNLYFIPSINRWVGFDMAAMLHRKIASEVLRDLRTIVTTGLQLTPYENEGLKVYRDALHNLIRQYPSERVIRYLDEATAISGLKESGPHFFDVHVADWFKRNARQNIADSSKLLKFLNVMISNYSLKPNSKLVITADRLNLHVKPNIDSPIVATLSKDMLLRALGPSALAWAQVAVEGMIGWVDTKWTKLPLVPAAVEYSESKFMPGTTLVVVDIVNMRYGPSKSTPALCNLYRGAKVKALGPVHKGWVQIKSNDFVGWVSEEYLVPYASAPILPPTKVIDRLAPGTVLEVVADTLRLRSSPNTASQELNKLPKGSLLMAVGPVSNGWVQVSSEGLNGWVYMGYTKIVSIPASSNTTGPPDDRGIA